MFIRSADYCPALAKRLLLNDDIYDNFILDDKIKFILFFASQDFYRSLVSDKKFNDKNKDTLFKYLLRMSSRAMIFSSIGTVSTPEILEETIEVRLTLSWLDYFKSKIEKNQPEHSELEVMISSLLEEDDNCFKLKYFSRIRNQILNVSVKKGTTIGKMVVLLKKLKYCKICEVYNLVCHEFGENSKRIINYLLENQILVSEIDFGKTINDNLERLSYYSVFFQKDDFSKVHSVIQSLKGINNKVGPVDYKFLLEKCIEVNNLLQEIVSRKEQFLTATKYNHLDDKNITTKDLLKLDDKLLSLLRKMNYFEKANEILLNLESKFDEKYGRYTEISLSSIFSDLDFVKIISGKIKESIFDFSIYDDFWYEKITTAIFNGGDVILNELDLNEINSLLDNVIDNRGLPSVSFDVKYQKLADGKFYLPPIAFSFPDGSYSSKFSKFNHVIEQNDYYEIDVGTRYIPDLVFGSIKGSKRINLENDFIEDEKDVTIGIDNINIGLDTNGLYLKNTLNGEIITPVLKSMASLEFESENFLGRFLVNFGRYFMLPPLDLNLNRARYLPYIPRIIYKNLVLSKRTWNIAPRIELKNSDEFKEYLNRFINQYSIPNIVCLCLKGEDTPIKLDSKKGLGMVYTEFKNSGMVVLKEDYIDYTSNLPVFEIIESKRIENSTVEICQAVKSELQENFLDEIESLTLVCNDYMYISQTLNAINTFFMKLNKQFFYTYYSDFNLPSIRLRFRNNIFVSELESVLDNLRKQGIISFYFASSYSIELGRYGGQYNFHKVLDFFCQDSRAAISHLVNAKQNEVHDTEQLMTMCLETSYSVFMDWKKVYEFLNRIQFDDVRKYSVNFRKIKRSINSLEIIQRIENKVNKKIFDNFNDYSNLLHRDYIVRSILHMQFNRRMYNLSQENEFLYYSLQIVKEKIYRLRK
ncbi:thiopeptide-type bacteriocin biosynthesis protein [Streptococcus acidominimus]|uniref:Putative lantibiotic dehydratase protein n=1 Tax=Streptococcus acidominimus TaxID=1326 RepID=A0A1Q8EBA1_STRAI|nr:thiopeptide-type bacteriocin biosynthesis protein [Streptococcus acidominimus]OLF49073.1 hypothetical protein BU200_09280 [Streptococcus acidominimus]SUN06814.1 putative lantibiotic dehydratase protein [Streptococcus acidominimus]